MARAQKTESSSTPEAPDQLYFQSRICDRASIAVCPPIGEPGGRTIVSLLMLEETAESHPQNLLRVFCNVRMCAIKNSGAIPSPNAKRPSRSRYLKWREIFTHKKEENRVWRYQQPPMFRQ
jgi:hypothetical protein